MGRITVFTSEDINSKQLLKALEKRQLPYQEISLKDQPSRISTLRALDNGPVVPQVFFNNRSVGGLDKAIKELKRWDQSSRFDTPLEKYKADIEPADDPEDKRLAVTTGGYKLVDPPPGPIQPHTVVKLPAGRAAPLREVTELMKDAIPPLEDHKYKGVLYRNCFSGKALLEGLASQLEIPNERAHRFIQRLLQAGLLHHVDQKQFPDEDASFQQTSKDFYQLQCLTHPYILNSYRVWPENRRDCYTVVEDLQKRLTSIEMSSLDDDGALDFEMARENPGYCVFEDAVCELQKFSLQELEQLDSDHFTAMALNIWWVMLRYAFLKIGIPTSESDRKSFMTVVKFYLAGETFTLDNWLEVLRGNSKHKFSIAKGDARLVLAAFMGAHNGSSWSSPFVRFSATNLNEQLDIAAAVFCRDDLNVSLKRKDGSVRLSSLFKQYHDDFGKRDKALLEFILSHSVSKRGEDIDHLLSEQTIKITYREPEMGYHASKGPWYNQKGVQELHDKKKRRWFSRNQDNQDSDHVSLSTHGSSHSGKSWM